jgi:hypothetical protein
MGTNVSGKIALLLTIIFANKVVIAQKNLVCNPSFEQVRYHHPEFNHVDTVQCAGWWSPDGASPDYFNRCNNYMDTLNKKQPYGFGVPYTGVGYSQPEDGDGFIGIIPISASNYLVGYMEHIQGVLTEPLKENDKYRVSFWVKLAYQYSDFIVYNMGAYFSAKMILRNFYDIAGIIYLNAGMNGLKAQISNPADSFLCDTNWVQIKGIYTAKGGEKYITLGGFWDDNPKVVKVYCEQMGDLSTNNKTLQKAIHKYMFKPNIYLKAKYQDAPNKLGTHFPYYFIDNVAVMDIKDTI